MAEKEEEDQPELSQHMLPPDLTELSTEQLAKEASLRSMAIKGDGEGRREALIEALGLYCEEHGPKTPKRPEPELRPLAAAGPG